MFLLIKEELRDIDNFFASRRFSFQQISFSLKDLRNEETHYLNLSDLPEEITIRVWRMFYKLITIIDPNFFDCTRDRPETRDFYFFFTRFLQESCIGRKLEGRSSKAWWKSFS